MIYICGKKHKKKTKIKTKPGHLERLVSPSEYLTPKPVMIRRFKL
jgi:hypothetical protein